MKGYAIALSAATSLAACCFGAFWFLFVRTPPVQDFEARVKLLRSASSITVVRLVDTEKIKGGFPRNVYYDEKYETAKVAASSRWRTRFLAALSDPKGNRGTPTCACDPWPEIMVRFETSKGTVLLYFYIAGDQILWKSGKDADPYRWLNYSPSRPQFVALFKAIFPHDREIKGLDPLHRHDPG